MAIIFDFLHSFGIVWDFNILFIICSTQRRVDGPKLLICLQTMPSRLAALLFLKALKSFSRFFIWNGDVIMDSVASCFFTLCGTWSLFPLVVVGEPPGLQ